MNFLAEYGFIFLIFLLPVLFVVKPLFYPTLDSQNESEINRDELLRRKLVLYRQIKELDMEREMGNVNEEDYISNRMELKREVSDIITQISS